MRQTRIVLPFLALIAFHSAFPAAAQQVPAGDALGDVGYALGPGDKVRVIVFNEPTLSGEFGVSDAGKLAFPLIGGIEVRGKSISEAQELIRATLADGYVNLPQVSLEIIKYRPYYIYGEVVRSGEYPFASGLTAQQAIASAGGYSYRAAKRHVYIRRGRETAEVRLDFKSNPTILILPGDTLRVGERHF